MNSSQADPLRHLKRIRNRTPSKASSSRQLSQTNIAFNESGVGLMESKLEETALLKENCYDANKYYSSSCEEYLRKIGFGQQKGSSFGTNGRDASSGTGKNKSVQKVKDSAYSNPLRQKTSQSEDSLKQILFSKQKPSPQNNEDVQILTFKKLTSQEQSSSQNRKTGSLQRQLEFQPVQPFPGDTQEQLAHGSPEELIPCSICNRKFNPASYEKHSKVCEKVFMKKRRQFSSQKQRSRSRDSKA